MSPDDEELLRRLGDVLDRVDPMPDGLSAAGHAVFTAATDPSVAGGTPAPLVTEVKPAGGATGLIPAAPPVHHTTRRRRGFLLWLLDLIGRPA